MECILTGLQGTEIDRENKQYSARHHGFAPRTFREGTGQNSLLSSVLFSHQNVPWDKVGMRYRQSQESTARGGKKHIEAHQLHQHRLTGPILVGAYQRGILAVVFREQKQPSKLLQQAAKLWKARALALVHVSRARR